MKTYTPRTRIALNIETIEDSEVREILTGLSALQNKVQSLNSGFSSQVAAAEQEAQAMITRMKTADQQFNEVLNAIKTQVQTLTNSALRYVQMNSVNLEDSKPKFRDSFVYLTNDALTNLTQLVDGLQTQLGGIINTQTDGTQTDLDMKVDEVNSPDMTPQNLLVSAIRKRLANLLPVVMQTVEKLEPIIQQAKTVNQNNEKIVGQLQEVMGSIPEAQAPVVEETEAFSPDIPAEEVEEAEGMEEEMGLEPPAEPGEATGVDSIEIDVDADMTPPEEEAAPEEATEEAPEEEGEPAPEDVEEEGGEPAPEDIEEEKVIEE